MEATVTNVDPKEIAKFSELSSSWWDLSGPSKSLHEINPLRLSFIKEHVSLNDIKAIDVGCGGGILSESLAKEGTTVTGIDLSEDAINAAKNHAEKNNLAIDYQCISSEALAKKQAAQYDVVTCMELLEHVPEPQAIINDCTKLVKPGGHLFFSTINRNLKAYLQAVIGAEYILALLPRGTHDYDRFIKPSELTIIFHKSLLILLL